MSTSPQECIIRLSDPDKSIRNEASHALAGYGIESLPLVVPLLENESWVIRYRACEVLGLLQNSACSPYLFEKLHDSRDHVRYMAVKGLGLLGDKTAVPVIIPMLEDENPFVRRMTVQTLKKFGGDEATLAVAARMDRETDPAVLKACLI